MAEMIRRMEELGTPPEAMLVMRKYLSRDVTRDIRDSERDRQRDMARERQRRHRAKLKADKGLAEANDAASTAPPERDKARDASRDSRIAPCDLTSLPFLDSEEATEKVRKKRGEDTRARGTRLPEDWQPNETDRQFAISHGLDPDQLLAEFRDYWNGVPGQRGRKIDWPGTWRNRVRDIGKTRGKPHGYRNGSQPHRTELQLALDKARQFARSGNQEYASVPEDEPADRH